MKATRITTVLVILTLTICFICLEGLIAHEEAYAKVSKAAVKKAKKYTKKTNKLFKVGSSWYCFSKKKVKTGLQKVGKEYYFFNKSTGKMLVKTGLKKVGSAYYYFSKKSGKAPALRNNVVTDKNGKIWFFKSNGKRYAYQYLTTGSKAGNIAAGVVISGAAVKPDGTASEAQLLKVYQKIVKDYGYSFLTPAEPATVADLGKAAKSMTDSKEGKCYNYAALTYVTFRALGASPVYYNGHFQTAERVHAWVIMNSENGESFLYDSNQDNVTSKGTDLFGKLITYQDDQKTSFTVEGSDKVYYPGSYIE